MSNDIDEAIGLSKINLITRHPFISILALQTPIIETSSEKIPAFGTNGRDIFYNREYFKSITVPEITFCLSHCIYHMIFGHPFRRGGRDPKIWDMAIDYVVNSALIAGKVGTMPKGMLYDSKYTHHMTADEVYDDLIKNKTPEMPSIDSHGFGESDGSTEIELSDGELEAAFDKFRQAMAGAFAASPDDVDPYIRSMIQELNDPKINWREYLDSFVRSSIKSGLTYKKMNRRSTDEFIFPALGEAEKVELVFAIDTSGSMGDEMLNDLKSEIIGFTEQFDDFEIHIWCFDTAVHNHQTFNVNNIEELKSYDMQGGGGTQFSCNWEYMKEIELQPDRFVMMTDGGDWDDHGKQYEDYTNTLFIVHSMPSRNYQPGHGSVCYYD